MDIGKESWPTCTGFPDAVSLRRSSAEASAPFPFTCPCPFVPLLPFCALWARFRFGFQRSQDLKCKENLTSVLFILFCKSGLLCLSNLHNQNSCVTSRSLKNCKSCLKKLGDTSRKSGTKYKQCKFQFHSICWLPLDSEAKFNRKSWDHSMFCHACGCYQFNVTVTTAASLNLLLEYLCVLMDGGSGVLCGLDKDWIESLHYSLVHCFALYDTHGFLYNPRGTASDHFRIKSGSDQVRSDQDAQMKLFSCFSPCCRCWLFIFGSSEFWLVDCPSRWSVYLSLTLFVDHYSNRENGYSND